MQKKLTITVDERVYHGLHNIVGPRRISVLGKDLEVAYQQMAQAEAREAEASAWAEGRGGR